MWERIRELEVLLASEKESERARKKESENREKERERGPPRHAGEPCFEEGRKTERQRKNYGERTSEEK